MNKTKLAEKLVAKLTKSGIAESIDIYRLKKDEFGEPLENPTFITDIIAYYSRSDTNKIYISLSDAAEVNKNYTEKLIVPVTENSALVTVKDILTLNSNDYKIIDISSIQDIVYEMTLQRK